MEAERGPVPVAAARRGCSSASSVKCWPGCCARRRDGQTVPQVPFENDDPFDRRIDDLLVAIAMTAE
ncbi:hypothetical protein UE99_017105 [Burkholderia cenocepacia]|jgi:hypothetical protein|nr:hypothetical protein [Burkholderia cenocepacia]